MLVWSRDENQHVEDTRRNLILPVGNSQRINLKLLPVSFPPYEVLSVITHLLGCSGTDNGFI